MELDFTGLNSIGNTAPEAQNKPISNDNKIDIEIYQQPTEKAIEGLQRLQRQADINKHESERVKAMYATYQDNIKSSGELQTDILKGLKAGEDIYSLFLKAVKAISYDL